MHGICRKRQGETAAYKVQNDFLKGIEGISFNMKNFMIKTEDPQGDSVSPSGDGYVNLGNINLTA